MAKTVKELKEELKGKIEGVKGKAAASVEKLKASYDAKIEKAQAKKAKK